MSRLGRATQQDPVTETDKKMADSGLYSVLLSFPLCLMTVEGPGVRSDILYKYKERSLEGSNSSTALCPLSPVQKPECRVARLVPRSPARHNQLTVGCSVEHSGAVVQPCGMAYTVHEPSQQV